MRRSEIIQAYEFIRKEFFPRWDKKKEWSIRLRRDLPSLGLCSLEQKRIEIQSKRPVEMPLSLFFIHEISHAVTNAAHTKEWMARMMRAAEKADQIDKELAQRIREEVTSYLPGNCEILTVKSICATIEDSVLDARQEIVFPKLINWIARSAGLYPQEFKNSYRKSMDHFRKAFDEARRFKLIISKNRSKNV